MSSQLDPSKERCLATFRFSLKGRTFRCSLSAEHGGRHEAFYADQPVAWLVAAYRETRIDAAYRETSLHRRAQAIREEVCEAQARFPRTPRTPVTRETWSKKSHHDRRPGAWLPLVLEHPSVYEVDFEAGIAWEDLMPWERAEKGKS